MTVAFKGTVISILCSMVGGPALHSTKHHTPWPLYEASAISPVLFLDSEHTFSVQDFAHGWSSRDHEAVDLGSNPSLLRVTLGKVNSEDLSPHLKDRNTNHRFTRWGVHAVIGVEDRFPFFPESLLLLYSGTSFLYIEVFLLRLPLDHCLKVRQTWSRSFTHHSFSSPDSCAVLSSLLNNPMMHQWLKNPLPRVALSGTYFN